MIIKSMGFNSIVLALFALVTSLIWPPPMS